MLADRIADIQAALTEAEVDGWLFAVFQGNDPISLDLLGLSGRALVTRRCYYVIPRQGEPRKLVSGLEPAMLDHLPGIEGRLHHLAAAPRAARAAGARLPAAGRPVQSEERAADLSRGSTPAPPSCSPPSASSWSRRPSSRSASRRSGRPPSSPRTGAPTPTCTASSRRPSATSPTACAPAIRSTNMASSSSSCTPSTASACTPRPSRSSASTVTPPTRTTSRRRRPPGRSSAATSC